jgi:hypothetical protein
MGRLMRMSKQAYIASQRDPFNVSLHIGFHFGSIREFDPARSSEKSVAIRSDLKALLRGHRRFGSDRQTPCRDGQINEREAVICCNCYKSQCLF